MNTGCKCLQLSVNEHWLTVEVVRRRAACQSARDNAANKRQEGEHGDDIPQPSDDLERLDQTVEDGHKAGLHRPQYDPKQLDDGELPPCKLGGLCCDLLRNRGQAAGHEVCVIPQGVHLLRLQNSHGDETGPCPDDPVVVGEESTVLTPSDSQSDGDEHCGDGDTCPYHSKKAVATYCTRRSGQGSIGIRWG